MTGRHPVRTVSTLIVTATVILILPAATREIPAQIPDPHTTPVDTGKAVSEIEEMIESQNEGRRI